MSALCVYGFLVFSVPAKGCGVAMIVTCPECASVYRVPNESVPPDGVRLQCPKCSLWFMAKPPEPRRNAARPTGVNPYAAPPSSTGGRSGSFSALQSVSPYTNTSAVHTHAPHSAVTSASQLLRNSAPAMNTGTPTYKPPVNSAAMPSVQGTVTATMGAVNPTNHAAATPARRWNQSDDVSVFGENTMGWRRPDSGRTIETSALNLNIQTQLQDGPSSLSSLAPLSSLASMTAMAPIGPSNNPSSIPSGIPLGVPSGANFPPKSPITQPTSYPSPTSNPLSNPMANPITNSLGNPSPAPFSVLMGTSGLATLPSNPPAAATAYTDESHNLSSLDAFPNAAGRDFLQDLLSPFSAKPDENGMNWGTPTSADLWQTPTEDPNQPKNATTPKQTANQFAGVAGLARSLVDDHQDAPETPMLSSGVGNTAFAAQHTATKSVQSNDIFPEHLFRNQNQQNQQNQFAKPISKTSQDDEKTERSKNIQAVPTAQHPASYGAEKKPPPVPEDSQPSLAAPAFSATSNANTSTNTNANTHIGEMHAYPQPPSHRQNPTGLVVDSHAALNTVSNTVPNTPLDTPDKQPEKQPEKLLEKANTPAENNTTPLPILEPVEPGKLQSAPRQNAFEKSVWFFMRSARGPLLSALVLGFAAIVAGGGVLFALWTAGWVSLDDEALPWLEAHIGVHPPYSRLHGDEVPLAQLKARATEAHGRGDWAAEAVLWQRAMLVAPEDETGKKIDDTISVKWVEAYNALGIEAKLDESP